MGEIVIDFMPKDIKHPTIYEQKAGGAPANVAATVAILGGDATFYSQVGNDDFGRFLINCMSEFGVNTDYILQTDKAKTGIVFVTLDEHGNRSFRFYRDPSADMLYSSQDYLDNSGIEDIFAFSSVSLNDMPIKDAHLAIIQKTRKNNGLIVFDANLRLGLWKDHQYYRKVVKDFISMSDIVKISEDEIHWITQEEDPDEGIKQIQSLGVNMILFTKGKSGASIYTKDQFIDSLGIVVKTIDTTGAGDAFLGAFLYKISLLDKHYLELDRQELTGILDFCNVVAAISTTKKGALAAIPKLEEVESFLNLMK